MLAGLRALLSEDAQGHRERHRERGRGQEVCLHASILARLPQSRLNVGLGPSKRTNCDRFDRLRHLLFEALEVSSEKLR